MSRLFHFFCFFNLLFANQIFAQSKFPKNAIKWVPTISTPIRIELERTISNRVSVNAQFGIFNSKKTNWVSKIDTFPKSYDYLGLSILFDGLTKNYQDFGYERGFSTQLGLRFYFYKFKNNSGFYIQPQLSYIQHQSTEQLVIYNSQPNYDFTITEYKVKPVKGYTFGFGNKLGYQSTLKHFVIDMNMGLGYYYNSAITQNELIKYTKESIDHYNGWAIYNLGSNGYVPLIQLGLGYAF